MSNSRSANTRTYLYYAILLIMFAAGLWFILARGSHLYANRAPVRPPTEAVAAAVAPASPTIPNKTPQEHLRSPLAILLLQLVIIIVTARLFGWLFRKIGQPPVTGEMFAGILLGPSVLGWLSPGTMVLLFPASSMTTLGLLSQVGMVLFMFVVGMELDLQHLREKASSAIMISHASIIVPFLLGAALALFLYQPLAAPETSSGTGWGGGFASFALFIGIAMSIAAFPVLARILEDRGLSKTSLGSTALACAAIDDVTAWCLLLFVIAIVQSHGLVSSLLNILLVLFFIGFMLFFVRPRIGNLIRNRIDNQKQSKGLQAGIMAFIFAGAWFTESLGIHALFGAFLTGVVMPSEPSFQLFLKERLEGFSSAVLLPLFFAFTGLRTQVSLLNDWSGWLTCLGIIGVAVAGKLGGSMLMARWTKMSWRDSLSIGILMNTRGLIELVVLNVGYDLGILSARIFVMMVIMALATTFMTAPLLSLVNLKKTV